MRPFEGDAFLHSAIKEISGLASALSKGKSPLRHWAIYYIENSDINNYDINQIGKMFKLNRINNTLSDIEKKSNKNKLEGKNNIVIYNINSKNFNFLIKKNQKKVKFIGIDEEDRTFNIHIFDSEDSLKKYNLENNNKDENCIIF